MNLFDTPAGFDDPIGIWMGCHRRIEKQLRTLAMLPAHISEKGVDAQATSAAQAVLRYFESAASHHHEDEDRDLFPLLEMRITAASDRARFRALRERLEAEHERMKPAWMKIRKPLQGIAEGIAKPLNPRDVDEFREIYASHIPAEEEAVNELVERYLSAADLESLGRSMAARRGVAFPA